MNNGSVTPTASHFNQVRYSGKKAFWPERPTYFIRAAAGGGTNMILYSLFIIIYKKSTKQKSPAAGLAA